ncbi:MAG: T9SS type A sorting domain-containing protein [Flavobacteriales bacterium]
MKTIKILFLVLFASLSSYAQDPQLFENDWYLQKVIIDDVEYLPPFSNFITRMNLSTGGISILTEYCEESFGGGILEYLPDNFFTLENGGSIILIGVCGNPEIIDFMNNHYSIYYDLGSEIAKNPFSYSFSTENGILTLTVVNSLGDIAIYGNEVLSNQDFDISSFKVYPNPVKDELLISLNSELNDFNIFIYSIDGKLFLSLNDLEINNNSIDLQKLTSGIYFIQFKNKYGQSSIKKFIKN